MQTIGGAEKVGPAHCCVKWSGQVHGTAELGGGGGAWPPSSAALTAVGQVDHAAELGGGGKGSAIACCLGNCSSAGS